MKFPMIEARSSGIAQWLSVPLMVLASLAVMFTLCLSPIKAQSFYGTIAGTVTDASGAIVPGATVTAINIGTNDKREVKTNAAGMYTIVSLVPSSYRVEVSAPNFKKFVQASLTVQVSSTSTFDVKLDVGAATETVEVTTEPPLLQTESGSVGSQVEGKLVQEMPLNGRNVMNLLALVPGVVPQQATQGSASINAGIHLYVNGFGNYSIGGGIANESAQYIDGAPNNVLGGNPPALIVTQDMVQEFKVESNAVSAEYGHFGGGVVNMTTKSGTNAFHGSVYEYVRNTVLNTNDFISNNNKLKKAPYHQNQYGAVIGGPIKRDKAFFMFSWENQSIHYSAGQQLTVPTKAERGEDTTATLGLAGAAIKNKLRTPFAPDGTIPCPGTILSGFNTAAGYEAFIPASCIDATAKVMKGFYAYPTGTTAGSQAFVNQKASGADSYQYNTRFDVNVSPKQRLFGRWTKWYIQTIGQDDFKGRVGHDPAVPSDFGSNYNTANNIVFGDTYTFNSNTIGDLRLSYMREHYNNYGSAYGNFDVSKIGSGWAALAPQMSVKQTPIFGLIGGPYSGPWNIPVGATQIDIQENFGLNASLIKIVGSHTFKMGMESQMRNHSGTGNYAWNGSFALFFGFPFGPGWGDAWGGFMLGGVGGGNGIHTYKPSTSVNWSHGAYIADTWRYNSKLTLNYGLHWDIPGGIYEKNDSATVFLPNAIDPGSASTYQIPGTLALTKSPMSPSRDMSPVKWNLISPRLSFAYSLRPDLVFRGGYGLSYIPPDMPIGLMAFNSPVNGVDTAWSCSGPGAWSHGFSCGALNGKIIQPFGRTDPNPSHIFYNQTVVSPVQTDKYPYMQQWNLSIGKQWKGNIETSITYAGSKGTKLPISGVSTGTGGSYASIDQLDPQYYYMGAAALSASAPCAKLGGQSVSVARCLQPFPQYNGVYNTGANGGGQNYNAIYVTLSKRFQSGGVFNLNYTRSRTVGDTDQPGFDSGSSWQDFTNPKGERSIASFDVANRMIISYVLNLPFGKGQKWANGGGVANVIVGGWQVNGITTEQSGFPLHFTNSTANSSLFYAGSIGNAWGGGVARPDLLPGCDLKTSGSWLDKFKNGTMFNTACLVPAGTTSPSATQNDQQQLRFGNMQRNTDSVRTQFLNNFDFAVTKTTSVTERTNLVFKAEFFNLFNHPIFGAPGTAMGSAGYGTTAANQSPMYKDQQNRLAQLSLRLNF